MDKRRLDHTLTAMGIVQSRSQAESWIRLGKVTVDEKIVTKPGFFVGIGASIRLNTEEQYVSRAGLKLASVAELLHINFSDKTVLDIGSSTGGFTDYALQHGASRVIAVDVGTNQLHQSLQGNPKIELHEKTDIRDFYLDKKPDIIVMDVSFISLRHILPHVAREIAGNKTQIVAMMKPQFEANRDQTNKGVIKNKSIRRQIIRDFEQWTGGLFAIKDKQDSGVTGTHGNQERFYLLQKKR